MWISLVLPSMSCTAMCTSPAFHRDRGTSRSIHWPGGSTSTAAALLPTTVARVSVVVGLDIESAERVSRVCERVSGAAQSVVTVRGRVVLAVRTFLSGRHRVASAALATSSTFQSALPTCGPKALIPAHFILLPSFHSCSAWVRNPINASVAGIRDAGPTCCGDACYVLPGAEPQSARLRIGCMVVESPCA